MLYCYRMNHPSWAGHLPLSVPAQSPLNCALQTAQIAHFSAHKPLRKSKHNGGPILEELGVAGVGEQIGGLKSAQLRKLRKTKYIGAKNNSVSYETGGECNRELTSIQLLLV